MKPNNKFLRQPKSFWASVRSLSQEIGYGNKSGILVPDYGDMVRAFLALNLNANHILKDGKPTELAELLKEYFEYRANVLNNYVEPRLMDVDRARNLFAKLRDELKPNCAIPLNKQKGDKKAEAYFTGIINMLIEKHSNGFPCNYDPRELTTITRDGAPLRTLARRIDGAFPTVVNPIAVWEIKEYYYTTTFGSRVADGVYETLLDGMEIEELREHEDIDVKHYLMLDAKYTWWDCGKSYLCRIVDMLHMGYVDEVLFGYEVIEELPRIVSEWVDMAKKAGKTDNITGELIK